MFKPKYTITDKMTQLLAQIERARGFLEALQLSSEQMEKMRHEALVLEAHSTTHIEGMQLTLRQSKEIFEGHDVPGSDPDDVRELLNYQEAFEFVSEYLSLGSPITEGAIREIHKHLVKNVRGNAAMPGEYRTVQNFVVNSKTQEVIYTPPPAFEIMQMMNELIGWIKAEKEMSPILVAGIAQFQFVHIHPFLDGNGRTARLLSTLCLYRAGYDFKRLFTLSHYYDRNRVEYYAAIQGVREKDMDMTEWLEYFCEGLTVQLRELREKVE